MTLIRYRSALIGLIIPIILTSLVIFAAPNLGADICIRERICDDEHICRYEWTCYPEYNTVQTREPNWCLYSDGDTVWSGYTLTSPSGWQIKMWYVVPADQSQLSCPFDVCGLGVVGRPGGVCSVGWFF